MERIDPNFPILDVVRPRLSPAALAELDALPDSETRLAAWRLWVRFEAAAKMSETGLREPIRLDEPSRARIVDVPTEDGIVAALSVAGTGRIDYRTCRWKPPANGLTNR